ncbi:hypothetical protein BDW67DRAFT_43886 [Aspergillus spinulosporus]
MTTPLRVLFLLLMINGCCTTRHTCLFCYVRIPRCCIFGSVLVFPMNDVIRLISVHQVCDSRTLLYNNPVASLQSTRNICCMHESRNLQQTRPSLVNP